MAVGDLQFDTTTRWPRIFFYEGLTATCVPGWRVSAPAPFLNDAEGQRWIRRRGASLGSIQATAHVTQCIPVDAQPGHNGNAAPLTGLRRYLRNADVVFGNLECPLSARGRPIPNDNYFRAAPEYARHLAGHNFAAVSFANNHVMDYGELAFADTLAALRAAGVGVVGAGEDYAAARRPVILEADGLSFGFLGYSMIGGQFLFAGPAESGVAPLNELVVLRDVRRLRRRVDYVIVSAHWGRENLPAPTAEQVALAHRIIDAGADVLLGHHSHVPGPIEVYRSRLICYSLGNCVFGHGHSYWGDNMIVRLAFRRRGLDHLEVLPIGGTFRPAPLRGKRAGALLTAVRTASKPFGTDFEPSSHGAVVRRGLRGA